MRVWAALLLAACLIWTSCAEETVPVMSESQKEIINFRITWKEYSGRGEAVDQIVQIFNEDQENYEIVVVGGNESLEDIRTGLQKGDMDVFVLPYRYAQLLGNEGLLAEMPSKLLEKPISHNLIELAAVDGTYFAMPWVSHSMALIYNQSLLSAAGVNPHEIKDRDTFVQALTKIEKNTDAAGIGLVGAEHNDLSWTVNQFIYGHGGSLMENGAITVNSPESLEGLKFYTQTLSQHAQESWKEDTGVEVLRHFREGRIAFEIQSLWAITDIWRNGNPFEVGVMTLDHIGTNSEIGPMMLCMPQDLDNDREAVVLEFIDFMTDTQAQTLIIRGEYSPEYDRYFPFRLPVRDDIIVEGSQDYELFEPFMESYSHPSIDVPTPEWQIIKDTIYTPYLYGLIKGDMTEEAFLEAIELEGEKILEAADE